MEISSFSTSSRRCCPPLSDTMLLKRTSVPERNRGSVAMFPSKSTCQPLSSKHLFPTLKENHMQVFCSQKKETPTLEARCMDEIYDALAERLVPTAAAANNTNFKHIVGMAGPPGAGKSTVASEVVKRINKLWPQKSCSLDMLVEPPEVATVLPMDGFHLYRHQLDAMEDPEEAHARRGAPWTFNPKLLLSCLKTLRDQGSVYAPSFDHGVGDPVEDDVFINLQHKVVIVEGNYLLLEEGVWNEISSIFDEKWFIDVDIDKAMERVLKRHISTGKPPNIAEQRIKYNDRPNAELIFKSKKNADLDLLIYVLSLVPVRGRLDNKGDIALPIKFLIRCMDEIYDALAERLVPTAAAANNTNFKHIVGMAGPPGAGKSTVASEVVKRINKLWPQKSCSLDMLVEPPEVATVLPMDGFHLYRHQLDAMEDPEEAHARRGAPWTFNPKLLLSCLKTLRDQGSVYAPSFDHGVGDPVEDDVFINLQHKVVIVEGNYLLLEEGVWNEISSIFDEKWFIDVDIDKAMERVLKRHISTGKPPNIAEQRIKYNDRPNAELIFKSKKNADLVIMSIDY